MNTDTVAVLLTGPGRGAIATVLVDGPRAIELVRRFFRAARSSSSVELKPNVVRFGFWEGQGSREELIVCRTAPAQVEIHCHGGRMASRSILDTLSRAGAAELSLDQWLARTLDDPSVIAARQLLARAPTERTTAVLLDQARGAMRRELRQIVELLETDQVPNARERLKRLLDLRSVALHLVTPWSVVLAGRPNAGKSSLVNALLGYERTVVFEQPGTTRDLVTAETAIDGWPVTLTDTAGLRQSFDPVEHQGVELAQRQITQANLIVLVQDGTNPQEGLHLPRALSVKHIQVISKSDLVSEQPDTGAIWTSTVTGQGIQELLQAIVTTLVPNPPPPGAALSLSADLSGHLESVERQLQQGDLAQGIQRLRTVL